MSVQVEKLLEMMVRYLDGRKGVEPFAQALRRVEGPVNLARGAPEITGHLDDFPGLEVPDTLWLARAVSETGALAWYAPYGDNPAAGRNFPGRAGVLRICGRDAALFSPEISAGFFVVLDDVGANLPADGVVVAHAKHQ